MNIVLSISFVLGGLSLIIYNKKLATIFYDKTQRPYYQIISRIGLNFFDANRFEAFFIKLNRLALVLSGFVLILMSYAILFGSIEI